MQIVRILYKVGEPTFQLTKPTGLFQSSLTSLMSLPLVFAQFMRNADAVRWLNEIFNYTRPIGFVIMILLIYAFSFFYGFLQVSPEQIAENLKKQGSYIPGVRPGKETENYISGILMRTTVGTTFLTAKILPIV